MVKNWTLVLYVLVVMLSCVFSSAHAQLPQIQTGLNYLSVSQNPDGTWGNGTSLSETTAATVSALDALKSLNQTSTSSYAAGLSWLQGQSPQAMGYSAERIRILSLGDGSVSGLLSALDPRTGASGGGDGYETNILDTALVLQALKSSDYSDFPVLSKTLAYLTNTQNADGGWGFTEDDGSNVFVTAHVLSTLSLFKSQYIMDQQLKNAAAFLLSKQNPDGRAYGHRGRVCKIYKTQSLVILGW